ncbi:MAG: hypothetical protein ACTHOG_04390, partial [Marmoricola sp.]
MKPTPRSLLVLGCGLLVALVLALSPIAAGTTPPPLTDRTLAPAISGITGRVGVLIATDRIGARTPLFVGNWSSGTAWSTAKVPVAIEALLKHPTSATIKREVVQAITASNNSAAHALWLSLGTGSQAASAVDRLLWSFGDHHTAFRSMYFGLSTWSLHEQAIFATRLSCSTLTAARTVKSLMGQVVLSQRWGLGVWSGAQFKGGWGPDAYGRYTVRQFGLLPYNHRWIAL